MTKKVLNPTKTRRKRPGQTSATVAISSIKIGKRHRRDHGDISSLTDSMNKRGLFHPVVVKRDRTLVAGARRLAAAKALGWKTIPVTFNDDPDAVVYGERDENAIRKNFTLSEAVAIADTLEATEREAAKQRQGRAGLARSEKFTGHRGRATDNIAASLGMSRPTLKKAQALVKTAKAFPGQFDHLVADMDKSGKVNAPFRRLHVKIQAEALRREVPPLPGNGPYHGGIIDVPHAYDPHDDSPTRGVLPYATLSIKQVCALRIGTLMHKDSVLFYWVTNFILARGLHLEPLTTWGFEPKTIITWPKDRDTFKAHWARGQTEHMVMAVRGKPVIDLTGPDLSTLLQGPFHLVRKGEHSAKPVEAYGFVERVCPAPRYCDLFSRHKHSDKWDCHGFEAPTLITETKEAAE